MGVDSADFNSDGNADLFVTNIDHEFYGLYRNKGDEAFDDVALPAGIACATQMLSGWGLKFFDFDNDGTLDLFMANGHPDTMVKPIRLQVEYRMPMVLLQKTGTGFKNVSAQAGPAFARRSQGVGSLWAISTTMARSMSLVIVNDGAPILLRNNVGRRNHWLGVRLIGRKANIDAIGAVVRYQAGSLKRPLSSPEAGASFRRTIRAWCWDWEGPKVDWLELHWPHPGGVERFEDLPADRYITIVEGDEVGSSAGGMAVVLGTAALAAQTLADPDLREGIALTRQGQFGQAIPHFVAAKGRGVESFALQFNLALCYVGMRIYTRHPHLVDHPLRPALRRGEGSAGAGLSGDHQPKAAWKTFQEAVALTPDRERLYMLVSQACMDEGLTNWACAWWKPASEFARLGAPALRKRHLRFAE